MFLSELNMIIVSDYARCDLYRKLQCLQELKDASQKLKMSYQQEWVGACKMPSGIKGRGGGLYSDADLSFVPCVVTYSEK